MSFIRKIADIVKDVFGSRQYFLKKELTDTLTLGNSHRQKIAAPKTQAKHILQEALAVCMIVLFKVFVALVFLYGIFISVMALLGAYDGSPFLTNDPSNPDYSLYMGLLFVVAFSFIYVFCFKYVRIEYKGDVTLREITNYIFLDDVEVKGRLNFAWSEISKPLRVQENIVEITLKEQFPMSLFVRNRVFVLRFGSAIDSDLFITMYEKHLKVT